MFLLRILSPVLILAASLSAAPIILFDGTVGTPSEQGWSYLSLPSGTVPTEGPTSTNLDTTSSNGISAGYQILPPVSVDLSMGIRFRFQVRVVSEAHVSNDRAGFSVILLGSNLQGIELAFWSNEIWAQNQNFTHGEGAAFDTSALTNYELYLDLTGYRLSADDQQILSGSLRNYNGQSASPLAFVYGIPNFLFLGDDTSSASASFDFASASIEQVPEPATFAFIAPALLLLLAARRSTVLQK
jgi:hypothetical protein